MITAEGMKAYYNEFEPFAASWLRELIKRNLIATGDVDERPIQEIKPQELKDYTQCHFFAGIGVWSYALRQSQWPDDRKVWTGSCPCQPFSTAGKQKGFSDERHLWPTWFNLISECKPDTVFGEQVASKGGQEWLDALSNDLENANYAVGSAITTACGFGAPHVRKRIYFVAHAECTGLSRFVNNDRISSTERKTFSKRSNSIVESWRQLETNPTSLPYFDGTPLRLARKSLHSYGNALVAQQAQAFIECYMDLRLEEAK